MITPSAQMDQAVLRLDRIPVTAELRRPGVIGVARPVDRFANDQRCEMPVRTERLLRDAKAEEPLQRDQPDAYRVALEERRLI